MKIVHMSDIHLTENGQDIWGVNTKSHFDKAIDIIGDIQGVDVIIVTGDLSNDGSSWSYNYISNKLSQLGDNIGDLVPPVALFWYR